MPLLWVPSRVVDRLTILEIFMRGNVYRDLHPTNTKLQGKLDWRDRNKSRGGGRPGLGTATPTVRAWAEECGITWVRTLVATDGNGRGPERQRPMARCTRCGILCRAVQYVQHGEYLCFWCIGAVKSRLWFSLGKYACGIRLGCTGAVMRRWRLSLLRHGAQRVPRARRLEDLALLAAIGALAGPELPKRVIVVRGRDRGLWPAVQRNYVPAVIDSLLHRDAYMSRFGAGG